MKRLSIAIGPADLDRLRIAARAEGLRLSAWIRSVALRAAERAKIGKKG